MHIVNTVLQHEGSAGRVWTQLGLLYASHWPKATIPPPFLTIWYMERYLLYIQSPEEQFLSTQCRCHAVLWHTGSRCIIIIIINCNIISVLHHPLRKRKLTLRGPASCLTVPRTIWSVDLIWTVLGLCAIFLYSKTFRMVQILYSILCIYCVFTSWFITIILVLPSLNILFSFISCWLMLIIDNTVKLLFNYCFIIVHYSDTGNVFQVFYLFKKYILT